MADLIRWAKEEHGGQRPWDDIHVRNKLAGLYAEGEIGRLVAYRTAWLQSKGEVPNYEASIGKVWFAMYGIKVANAGVNLMGGYGQLAPGSKCATSSRRGAWGCLAASPAQRGYSLSLPTLGMTMRCLSFSPSSSSCSSAWLVVSSTPEPACTTMRFVSPMPTRGSIRT